MELKDILEQEMWKVLAEEGIDKDLVDMIDLRFGDDVVEDKMHGVCRTQKTNGGDYLLVDFDNPSMPLEKHSVSPEHLKILRARYLIRRGEYSKQIHHLPNGEWQKIAYYYNLDRGTSELLERLTSPANK